MRMYVLVFFKCLSTSGARSRAISSELMFPSALSARPMTYLGRDGEEDGEEDGDGKHELGRVGVTRTVHNTARITHRTPHTAHRTGAFFAPFLSGRAETLFSLDEQKPFSLWTSKHDERGVRRKRGGQRRALLHQQDEPFARVALRHFEHVLVLVVQIHFQRVGDEHEHLGFFRQQKHESEVTDSLLRELAPGD